MAIIDIFSEAIEISDPDERMAFVEQSCKGDAAGHQQVIKMLEQYYDPATFMGGPAIDAKTFDNKADSSTPPNEKPGDRIGRYKLLEKIGEGGMGLIYMAEQQEPVVRRVALKIIKWGMDTKQVVARFEAERQALAMMDHPHVAKVLDAGATDSGRPYFVMELVHGIPITEYCDSNRLNTEQRLQLFLPVCQAIQHAHQKGLIHRDIKPSNVMVTLNDGEPHPMVIDFGIAKATHQKLTEKTLFTNFGQVIGTPAYMSPEQAQMSKLDVDTRTDVYALGVLLYELLTGTTPFTQEELMGDGYAEMQRVIAEREPPKPSARLSTMLAKEKTAVAQKRQLQAASLGRGIQGDLDWIVMKSLEKDRTRRYDTVSGFASDIKRHLNNEPVSAVAPTFSYQLHKLWQRNRRQMKWIGAAVTILALFAVVSTALAYLLNRANDTAQSRLFDSLVSQADAIQTAGKEGYHTNVFNIVSEAVAYRGVELTSTEKVRLREIAMATITDTSASTRRATTHEIPDRENLTRLYYYHSEDPAALGYADGSVHLHDVFTSELLGILKGGHNSPIHSIVPSRTHDGWVTSDRASLTIAWKQNKQTQEWEVFDKISTPDFEVPPLVLECGHRVLLFAERTNDARLWIPGSTEAPTRIELPATLARHSKGISLANYVVISPSWDGQFLAIPSKENGSVIIYNIETNQTEHVIAEPGYTGYGHPKFSHNDEYLCVGWGSRIVVYETNTWSQIAFVNTNVQGRGWNFNLATHAPLLAYGRYRKTIWNYESNRIEQVIESLPGDSYFEANEHSLFTLDVPAAYDKWTVQEFQPQPTTPIESVHIPTAQITKMAFSPSGRWLAAGSDQGILIIDPKSKKTVQWVEPEEAGKALGFSFSHDETLLAATFQASNQLRLWETKTWSQLETPTIDTYYEVSFHPHHNLLALSQERALSLFRYQQSQKEGRSEVEFKHLKSVPYANTPLAIGFNREGTQIAYSVPTSFLSDESTLLIAKLHPEGLEEIFRLSKTVTGGFDFLKEDGHLIVSRVFSENILDRGPEHWDYLNQKNAPLARYESATGSIAASPHHDLFAGEFSAEGLTLYNWRTQERLGRMAFFDHDPKHVQWTPDGKHLAILFEGNEIQFWDIEKIRNRLDEIGLNW